MGYIYIYRIYRIYIYIWRVEGWKGSRKEAKKEKRGVARREGKKIRSYVEILLMPKV